MTLPELEALMRKHRMTIEYGGDTPAANAFRAGACAHDETWDEVAECYGPTLSDAISGLVAQLEDA